MQKKLLIVDDSMTSRQIIRANISKLRRDWAIFESYNGFDALEMVGLIVPDYVAMDVNMPNMSGLEAAEKVLKINPNIKITLVTANTQEYVRRRAQELGMGFVEKPINKDSVTRTINFFEAVGTHV